jgi:hypothetical protein
MGKSSAGGRRDAGDERLPDHQFQLDAERHAGIDPTVTQFGQLWQFGRVFVTGGRQQRWRWRLRKPRVAQRIRVDLQLSQCVGQRRRQYRDDRRRPRQCRLDRIPRAGLPGLAGWAVVRVGRFGAAPATGLAVAAGRG